MDAAMLTLHSACAVLVWVAVVLMIKTGFRHVLVANTCELLCRGRGLAAFVCWLCPRSECWAPAAGPVDFRHAFIDMSRVEVRASNYTRAGRTCPAAMGFSFAAGTTDGERAGAHPQYLQMLRDIDLFIHHCTYL